ncbi:hypothetical protein CKM354_000644500 [Cercospora kikuchii]|uniref:Uncharacterized protein n=1 Tax=Cercospora kikuchii TaxID=84275 RepID=A0A9P3CI61_9PEZI|nr:uncharacterized protein CKM354_000644500 [Cercospora kikuchii]GIZ43211.1 hypothetical protein CKM354_000644500 [Cercospora kikuchii]
MSFTKFFNPPQRIQPEPSKQKTKFNLNSVPPSFDELEETLPLCTECHYNHVPQEDLTWPEAGRLTLYSCERFCEECHEDDFNSAQQLRKHIIRYHGEQLKREERPGGVTIRRRRVLRRNGKGVMRSGAEIARVVRGEVCPGSEPGVGEEDEGEEGSGEGEEEEEEDMPDTEQEGHRGQKRKSEEYNESPKGSDKAKKQMRDAIVNSGLPNVVPEGWETGALGIPYDPSNVVRGPGSANLVKTADLQKMPPPPIPGPGSTQRRTSIGSAGNSSTLKRKPKTGDFSIFHTIGADYDHRHEPPPELKRGSLGILYDPAEVSDGEEEGQEGEEGGVPIEDSPVETEAERKAREMDELAGRFNQGPPDVVLDSLLDSDDEEEEEEEEVESSEPDEDADD